MIKCEDFGLKKDADSAIKQCVHVKTISIFGLMALLVYSDIMPLLHDIGYGIYWYEELTI